MIILAANQRLIQAPLIRQIDLRMVGSRIRIFLNVVKAGGGGRRWRSRCAKCTGEIEEPNQIDNPRNEWHYLDVYWGRD